MRKNLKIFFVILLLIAMILPITYSYAIAKTEQNIKEKQFFEISKLEVTKNEKVEMTINLDAILYNEFIFELQSSENMQNVEIDQSNKIETEQNANEIIMEINKEKTNINTINLYYSIPENKKVGDTIKFVASITNIIANKSEEINENQNTMVSEKEEINTDISSAQMENQKEETQSIEFEVKIVEEKNEEKNNDKEEPTQNIETNKENTRQEMQNNQEQIKNDTPSTNGKGTMQNSSVSYSNNMEYSRTSSSNQTEKTVTYNGSDNNYLNELSVEGYTLNKDFSKENTTYFMTIKDEIETLDILAIVEDDTATACVYGNENLKEGTNKILISVTAENGNVRNYRIYVTKKV